MPLRNVAASAYARLHERFLRLAGGEAECAQEAALTMLLRPGLRLLDAGCGPAPVARRLLAREPGIHLTLVDQDMRMLAGLADMPAPVVRAGIAQLPFPDRCFDVVFAFWSLEMLEDPVAGLASLVRVTRPGGRIAVTFCAQRDGVDWIDRLHAFAIRLRRTGRFLDPRRISTALRVAGAGEIVTLHCRGPVCALIARRGM
ncbi:MAG: methyltransferase domain-containing protein [Salinarimonas sp.]|nr:methyltransferase domain-containing protein [Salinarimonas sp.]